MEHYSREEKRGSPRILRIAPTDSGNDCGPIRGCKSAESQMCGSVNESEQASTT